MDAKNRLHLWLKFVNFMISPTHNGYKFNIFK